VQPNSHQPGSKVESAQSSEEIPQTIKVDITPATYIAAKQTYMAQVPKLARPFVDDYFDFIKGLQPDWVLDWMEGNERLKDLYAKRSFPERIAIAGARGLLRSSRKMQDGARRAINFEVTAATIRFENPAVWEVIEAFGQEGINKLKQGIEDIKEILKLKETA